ncbi:MAG: Na+/H+ antiporter subunit E [Lachnospiraceae bacterium]
MYLLFFAIWVILNGKINLEITIFGLVIAALMYAFICKFMEFSIQKDIFIFSKMGYIIAYLFILFWEILKANVAVLKLVFSAKYEMEPAIIHFKTTLHTKGARVMLANAITLTPGTITVSLDDDEYVVHCLDKDFGEGIEDSVFTTLLARLEAPIAGKRGK